MVTCMFSLLMCPFKTKKIALLIKNFFKKYLVYKPFVRYMFYDCFQPVYNLYTPPPGIFGCQI